MRFLPKAVREIEGEYTVVTIHRPENTDNDDVLRNIMEAIVEIAADRRVVWPLHPRTRAALETRHIKETLAKHIDFRPPVGYCQMIGWLKYATSVVTDSGGVQEETSVLGVPCVTVRNNTERPITIREGSNVLVAEKTVAGVLSAEEEALAKKGKGQTIWDGKAGERIARLLLE